MEPYTNRFDDGSLAKFGTLLEYKCITSFQHKVFQIKAYLLQIFNLSPKYTVDRLLPN